MTLQRLRASAPSRKVQTIERSYAYLAHHAPHVQGVHRALGSNRYLSLRVASRIARERALGRSMEGMARKCGGRRRIVVATGDRSRSPNSPIGGHPRAPGSTAPLRRMLGKHGMHGFFVPGHNTSQICSRRGAFRLLEHVAEAADPHGTLRCAARGGVWQRGVNSARDQKYRRFMSAQMWPASFWARHSDGLCVREFLTMAVVVAHVADVTCKGYAKRAGRIRDATAAGIPLYAPAWILRLGPLGHALGSASMFPMLMLFATVPHSSFLQAALGVDYHGMIRYHRWAGRLSLTLLLYHGVAYFVYWAATGVFWTQVTSWERTSAIANVPGEISLLCGLLLAKTSAPVVRRALFELFYKCHLAFTLGFLAFGFAHAPAVFLCTAPALALFAVDLVFRALGLADVVRPQQASVCRKGGVAEITFLVEHGSGDGLVGPPRRGLDGPSSSPSSSSSSSSSPSPFSPSSSFRPPGCPLHRVYVSLPSFSRTQWHPFSAIPQPDGTLRVVVKRFGRFTGALFDGLEGAKRETESTDATCASGHAGAAASASAFSSVSAPSALPPRTPSSYTAERSVVPFPLPLRVSAPREPPADHWRDEDAVVILAGGIGAAAAFAVLEDLLEARRRAELEARWIEEAEFGRAEAETGSAVPGEGGPIGSPNCSEAKDRLSCPVSQPRGSPFGSPRGGAGLSANAGVSESSSPLAGSGSGTKALPGSFTAAAAAAASALEEPLLGSREPSRRLSSGPFSGSSASSALASMRVQSVTLVWVVRDPRELLVVPPDFLRLAADPDGWLRVALHCTGKLRGRRRTAAAEQAAEVAAGAVGPPTRSSSLAVPAASSSAPSGSPFASLLARVSPLLDPEAALAPSRPTSAQSTSSTAWAHVDAALDDEGDDEGGGQGDDEDLAEGGEGGHGPALAAPPSPPSARIAPPSSFSSSPSSSSSSAPPLSPPRFYPSSPLRPYAQKDWLWVLVHVLALVGGTLCVCLAGSYRAEVTAYAHSRGLEPDRKHVTWRATCLYGAGLVVGTLGFPAFFVLGPVKVRAWLEERRRAAFVAQEVTRSAAAAPGARGATKAAGEPEQGPPLEGPRGPSTDQSAPAPPYPVDRSFDRSLGRSSLRPSYLSPQDRVLLREGRLFLSSLDVSFPIAYGRPSVDGVVARAAAELSEGETLGVYAAGPDPLNAAAILAGNEANRRRKDVFVDVHRLTATL